MTSGDARARRKTLVTRPFLLVLLSTLGYFLCVGMLLPVVPRFVEGPLGGSDVAVGVTAGIFSLTAVLMRPFVGPPRDPPARRPLIVGGSAIVAASVLAYHLADSIAVLLVFRLIAGVGEAMFFVGAASAINDLAPEERRGEAVSYFTLSLYAGISFGPILGETLLDGSRFGLVWSLAAAFGFVASLLALRVRDARPEGAATAASARLVHPAALLPGLVLASTVWAFAAFSSFVSLYALELGMDGSRFVFFTYSFTILLIRFFGARIPDALGPKRAATIATTTVAAGMIVMSAWGSPAGLYVGAFVFGIGQAFGFPALMTLAVRGAPASERGAVVGTYSAFFDLAFGLGAISLGPVAHTIGYRGTFAVSAAVSAAGFLLLRLRVREATIEVTPGG
ncbi:MAG: MFS transporter [Actinomycetota bacterium]